MLLSTEKEKIFKKKKINNLPDKKIQNIGKIIKMLTELGKRIATVTILTKN